MVPIRFRARAARSLAGAALATAVAAAPSFAIEEYAAQIPNLSNVPQGCDGLCHGIGDKASEFSNDFVNGGETWNPTFAGLDSDGDGFSNGWELQDPSGTWISGTADPGSAAFVANPTSSSALPPLPVAFDPTSILHTEAAGENGSESFALQNVGGVAFDYSISASDPWLAPDPPAAMGLPVAMQDEILVLFTTNGLLAGLYEGELTVAIPGIRADRIPPIPVDLTVPEPGAVATAGGAALALALLARRRTGARA